MKPRLVLIEWVDIKAHDGDVWQSRKKVRPAGYAVTSVGWLIYEDEENLVLCQDLGRDKRDVSGIATYPRGCVRRIVNLSEEP